MQGIRRHCSGPRGRRLPTGWEGTFLAWNGQVPAGGPNLTLVARRGDGETAATYSYRRSPPLRSAERRNVPCSRFSIGRL
jgi:hypothetical protein